MLYTSYLFIFEIVLLFFCSCCLGSFLAVLIERIPRKESAITGRSHCDFCQQCLPWYDMFPLISFLVLQGKCRYCRKKIGLKPFVIELFSGVVFTSIGYTMLVTNFFSLANIFSFAYVVCLFSCFICIAFIDAKQGIIPNSFVYVGIFLALLYNAFFFESFFSHLLSGVITGVFFFFLFAITKGRGMGFGDVKLSLLLGLFLGFPKIIIALYIAFLTGAIVAFILIIEKKKKFLGGTIPFGPFLIVGTFIASLWGNFLWSHVLSFF